MSDLSWIPGEYKRLAVVNDVNIYSDDAKTLGKGQWVNDNVITFLLEMAYGELDHTRKRQVHVIHASICEILKYDQDDSAFFSYFETANLPRKDIIIFVLNDNQDATLVLGGMHWALLFFDRSRNEFIYLDSLISCNPGTLTSAQHIHDLFTKNNYLQTKTKPPLIAGRCAKQKNGSDCGMYVVEFGRAIMQLCAYNENTLKRVVPEDMMNTRNYWLNRIHQLYRQQERS